MRTVSRSKGGSCLNLWRTDLVDLETVTALSTCMYHQGPKNFRYWLNQTIKWCNQCWLLSSPGLSLPSFSLPSYDGFVLRVAKWLWQLQALFVFPTLHLVVLACSHVSCILVAQIWFAYLKINLLLRELDVLFGFSPCHELLFLDCPRPSSRCWRGCVNCSHTLPPSPGTFFVPSLFNSSLQRSLPSNILCLARVVDSLPVSVGIGTSQANTVWPILFTSPFPLSSICRCSVNICCHEVRIKR